jgi:hypothetical protein
MQNITSVSGLKNAIQLLEVDQAIKGQLLKEQFYITYESLKPINLLKSALNEVSTSPYLIDNILGTVMGLVSGYLSKKVFIGGSGNIIRKLMGSILQFGITNVVAKHSDAIKAFGQVIIQYILHRKEINSRRGD